MFPPSILIAMADHTEKPISEVAQGNAVISGGGDESIVGSVDSTHYEGSMVRILYQDAGVVMATPDQVFVTERGNVRAGSLVPGDRLETPYYGSGWLVFWEVESAEHFPYRGGVRGLSFDGSGHTTYCAGGVLVRETPEESR